MNSLTQRQFWIATLAKAELNNLEQQISGLESLPDYGFLRRPEAGLVMVSGRAGGTGQPFNLGEMTMTRCVVQLSSNDNVQIAGFGYVAGRSQRHAELAALCDALLQHPGWHSAVWAQVIEPLKQAAQAQQEQQRRQAEATRVNFFSMVRGE
ncbi:phosphonate C-P lyase system protein PhnG [Leptolyngbya sp. FACHB-711]|uniref:phosphonate C-P lyase system protein PhnG n=1 Tax=unclassified Leptolyngbya TaxID=2650499 RepID=UPI001684D0BD|nr:phosphonate C-P lyase system protein PhnG [Leptolyngbya sp. FACHB-711]MBD2027886.1 phosphonate C-P lyase system protein PhnG [Leptolyngbya sp. FACHB-711]